MIASWIGFLLAGCEPNKPGGAGGADSAADSGDATGPPAAEGCRAEPGPDDRERRVVVSYPYDGSGGQANTWRAHALSADGQLTEGELFEMGRATAGHVAFSPDGTLGIAPQEDGSIGIFTVSDAGEIAVVNPAFSPGFYAVEVSIDPSGEIAWVVDGNWVENGGGIYRVPINCETGEPGEVERVIETKLPVAFLHYRWSLDRIALVGWEVPGADPAEELHVLEAGDPPSRIASAEAFGDDEAIFSSAALTADDRYVLIADYSAFSGVENRVAVVSASDAPVSVQSLDIYDPVDIATSPFDDAALVLSGYGDAVELLAYDPDADPPFAPAGTAAGSALPTAAAQIDRGGLKGLVLVTENQGVRGLRFEGGGAVSDLGLLLSGSGLAAIPGAVGVQP